MVSVLKLRRPFVVAVVVERQASRARQIAAGAFADGADAVELNLASLAASDAPGRSFFAALRGPAYTSCRRAAFMGVYGPRFAGLPILTDDERMDRQLAAVSAGAAGLDIEADTFSPARDEWTTATPAVRRQSAVAATAHRARRAVIYSWHPPRKLTFAEARRGAVALRDRGADFVKIVERVRNTTEALDSVEISLRLRDVLGFHFVFLALGPGAAQFRPFMTSFGAAYLLARPSKGSNRLAAQPLVSRARALIDLA